MAHLYFSIGTILGAIVVLLVWAAVIFVSYCSIVSYARGLDKIVIDLKVPGIPKFYAEFKDYSIFWLLFLSTFVSLMLFLLLSFFWGIVVPGIGVYLWINIKREESLSKK